MADHTMILEEGVNTGFSAVESFEEKTERQEYECLPAEEPVLHRQDLQRISVRAFWESGDPVGFTLSNPAPAAVKAAFSSVHSALLPDQVENFSGQLPAAVKKVNPVIFDESVDSVNIAALNRLIDQVFDVMESEAFRDMELHSIHLTKTLKKIYIANTRGLNAKYIKTLFTLRLSLGAGENRIEVNQGRVIFQHLDPLRLISRGSNLLHSLTENQAGMAADQEVFLILAPEVSVLILKEFSHYFKIKADKEIMDIQYPSILNIVDDPLMDGQAGSVPFDDEGVQVQPGGTYLVRKGAFSNVITNLSGGFQNKSRSTGNGFRNGRSPFPSVRFSNLYIKPTVLPLKNLRSDVADGIVVSLVKLKSIDNRGYLFSAYGYRFRDQRMMEPVRFLFRTSFRSYLLNILKVSKEIKFFHSTYTVGSPYILVKARTKAGNLMEI
jgi:predicted Zn-dependent protease